MKLERELRRRGIGELGSVIKGRNLSVEVKKDLRNSITLAMLTYGSEVWKWNEMEQSKVRAVEMSYLRTARGVTYMDGVSNEEAYRSFGM